MNRSSRPIIPLTLASCRRSTSPGTNDVKLRFDIINILDQVYELRTGTGVGVGAPQYGPRRAFYGGVSFDF